MHQSSRATRGLVLASVIGLVLGACSPAASTSPGATGAAPSVAPGDSPVAVANACGDAPVTLNVWGGYPELDAVYKKAGEAYKAKHANVDVTVFSTDLRGFEQKLTTALPSNTAGDVVIRTSNFLARFIDQGLLAPVPADLASFVSADHYVDTVIKDASYKDKVVGVPLFSSGTALYYNKDMLAEAGLAGPPTSMDQIWEYAKKLAKVDASGNVTRSGLSLRLSGQGSGVAEKFWILLLQYGHELVKETAPGKWAADYNGPDGVALLQRYVDSLRDKLDSPNIDHDAKAFETKATAMFAREPWVVADIATNAPDLVGHYGSISLPVADLGATETMYVPASAANPACSWDFVKFLTEQEQQLTIPTISGWLPSRKDLDLTEFLAANPGYEGFLKKPDGLKISLTPPLPEFDELETKLATHLVDAYADYANLAGNPEKIQALMNTWAEETNQILAKGGHGG
ncbi:MAG TPA: extracellular solute-binding protein [Patescibacteria group bacterium]|nr:extracellular solute-binding protein [Patescibacteria group bacterium]